VLEKTNLKELQKIYREDFNLALSSADWHKDPYRFGYIRQSLRELDKIWHQNYSTIKRNFDHLVEKGLLSWDKANKVYQVNNYHFYTFKSSNNIAKKH
jgi:predicted transcriptional regulator